MKRNQKGVYFDELCAPECHSQGKIFHRQKSGNKIRNFPMKSHYSASMALNGWLRNYLGLGGVWVSNFFHGVYFGRYQSLNIMYISFSANKWNLECLFGRKSSATHSTNSSALVQFHLIQFILRSRISNHALEELCYLEREWLPI